MEIDSRFLGLHFLEARELRGRAFFDINGERLGSVAAVVPRMDGAVDILVVESSTRGRVHRLALDEVEIDDRGSLWRRSPFRTYRVVAPTTADSLTER